MSEAAGGRVLGHVPGVHDGEGALVGSGARVDLAGTAAAAAGGGAGGFEAGAGKMLLVRVSLLIFLSSFLFPFPFPFHDQARLW